MAEENKKCTTCEECDATKFEGVTEEDMDEWGDPSMNPDDFEDGDL